MLCFLCSGSGVQDLLACACRCVWNGNPKELVAVGNPRQARVTAEAQAFIDRGQSKTVTTLWGSNPEGEPVAMHDCQMVFVSYETLRKELGRARWAWLLHLKEPHTVRQTGGEPAPNAGHQGLQAERTAFMWTAGSMLATMTLGLKARPVQPCL